MLGVNHPLAGTVLGNDFGRDVLFAIPVQGPAQGDALGGEKACGQGACRQLLEFIQVEIGAEQSVIQIVQGRAVDVGDLSQVGGGLHPTFDFETVYSGPPQPAQGRDQTKILGAHDLAVSRVLGQFPHVLSGAQAFFQTQPCDLVVKAAGMGALAEIGGTAVDVCREQTTAGNGHAHRAVNKDFQLQAIHLAGHGPDAAGAHFPGQVDPVYSLILPELGRGRIGRVGLGREMDGDVRDPAAGHGHDAGIGDNDAVYS